MRAKLILERRTEHARLDARGARDAIDLEHAIEMREIDRYGARVCIVARQFDAADHARPAAVRDRRGSRGRAPIEERRDLRLAPRKGHDVGRIRIIAAKGADHVAKSFAVGMRGTIFGCLRAKRRERCGRRQPRPPQIDLLEAGRLDDRERPGAEASGQTLGDRFPLIGVRAVALVAPAPEFPPALRHRIPVVYLRSVCKCRKDGGALWTTSRDA